jgi:hypothetical protein
VISSSDGRYVVFGSTADNLVANDTNTQTHVFERDTVTNSTRAVSPTDCSGVTGTPCQAIPLSVSSDGRYVLFRSADHRLTSATFPLNVLQAYRGHGSDAAHLFACLNRPVGGVRGRRQHRPGGLSSDGRSVVFGSWASNLRGPGNDTDGVIDVFVRDIAVGITTRISVSPTGGQRSDPSYEIHGPTQGLISADGRFALFGTASPDLLPPGTTAGSFQIYRRDLVAGTTAIASLTASGQALASDLTCPGVTANSYSNQGVNGATISADGRLVTFTTTNPCVIDWSSFVNQSAPWVQGPNPNVYEMEAYVHDMTNATSTSLLSYGYPDSNGNHAAEPEYIVGGYVGGVDLATISVNGRYAVYASYSQNIVPLGSNPALTQRIYVRDLGAPDGSTYPPKGRRVLRGPLRRGSCPTR